MKTLLLSFIPILVFLLAGCAASRPWTLSSGQHPQLFQKEITTIVSSNFLLYLPREFGREKKEWPLILFLHGAGERGSDLEKVKTHGPPKLLEKEDFPFIVVSPQAPEGAGWMPDLLNALLDEVIERLPVDRDRIYLTGLSMGGFGTWRLAIEHPERFAAIAPICGGGEAYRVCRLKNLPVWAFHGAKDNVVPLKAQEEMVEALKQCGGNVKFTVYPEAGHDSWTETYANPELYRWFLEHRRQH
jgi:predicted peptidase